jgi:hypothetical protein
MADIENYHTLRFLENSIFTTNFIIELNLQPVYAEGPASAREIAHKLELTATREKKQFRYTQSSFRQMCQSDMLNIPIQPHHALIHPRRKAAGIPRECVLACGQLASEYTRNLRPQQVHN